MSIYLQRFSQPFGILPDPEHRAVDASLRPPGKFQRWQAVRPIPFSPAGAKVLRACAASLAFRSAGSGGAARDAKSRHRRSFPTLCRKNRSARAASTKPAVCPVGIWKAVGTPVLRWTNWTSYQLDAQRL